MADKTQIMKEAQKYLAKGQVDKAIAEWEKLISEAPDGNTYNIVGDLHFRKGDRKKAVDSYHKAANFFRHEGFSLKALALYKKILNINSGEAEALNALGQLSEEKGLTTDATKYYLAAADSLSKEGKKDQLIGVYRKILSLSPANANLRQKVADIFLKEGLRADAMSEYVQVARIHEANGDFDKAGEFYGKVLGMDPKNREAKMGSSYLCEKTGDIEKAAQTMQEASVLFPDDAEILYRHAEVSYRAGDEDGARDSLYRIIELEPGNMKPRKLLGEIYMKAGLKDRAWTEYLPAIDQMILEDKYEDAVELLKSFKDVEPLETGRRLTSLYRQLGRGNLVVTELSDLGDALVERGMTEDGLSCYREALDLSPDDAALQEKIGELTRQPEPEPELEPERGLETAEESEPDLKEAISVRIPGEKTAEEIFIEADIFSRYGLVSEALKLLQAVRQREPHNIDLHMRLKGLYLTSGDKESVVTECLILHELYKRGGDAEAAEQVLQEAGGIYPEDPRLTERGYGRPHAQVEEAEAREEAVGAAPGGRTVEDYEEEIAEADFYARQGLIPAAEEILKRLGSLFPEDEGIQERLLNLGQMQEMPETSEISAVMEEESGGESEGVELASGEPVSGEDLGDMREGVSNEQFEDLVMTDEELVEAQEMPEPELDSDVLDIFQEFKKGLEKELGEEDSETHYNLGIAYKEMGLLDDAITEFQRSRNDPKRMVQSSTMLGICYMEKGLYSLAIDVLNKVLGETDDKEETYWAVKYDLAEAHEKNNDLKEALALYTDVYGWNARFRSVSEKVGRLKSRLGESAGNEKPKEKKNRVSYL